MTTRAVTFKVEKASHLGALHLVTNAPGRLSPASPLAPVMLYLDLLKESGHRTQKNNLERAANLLGGSSGLDFDWFAIRSRHLELLIGQLKGKGYSPSLINSTISAVRGVARWAWHLQPEWMTEHDYLRICDVRLVKGADERRRPARALSGEEIKSLFESCEREESICATRDAALLALLYAGGLRRDEACQLELSSFNHRTHKLTVHGKGDKHRTAYFVDGGARRALNAWLRARGDLPGALLAPVTRHGQVVTVDAGGVTACAHLSQSGLYRALERRAHKAGISHFTPHDLRRSVGTHLLAEGEDLDTVRRIYGHADIRTTQTYIMRGEKEMKDAALKIKVSFRTGRRRKKKKEAPPELIHFDVF